MKNMDFTYGEWSTLFPHPKRKIVVSEDVSQNRVSS